MGHREHLYFMLSKIMGYRHLEKKKKRWRTAVNYSEGSDNPLQRKYLVFKDEPEQSIKLGRIYYKAKCKYNKSTNYQKAVADWIWGSN